MKKKVLICVIGVGVALSGCLFFIAPKCSIKLNLNDDILEWSNKEVEKLFFYEVFNGEYKIVETNENSYVLNRHDLLDLDSPDKIKKMTIQYDKNNIYLVWDSVEDKGTNNEISVYLIDNNHKTKYYSNTVNKKYVSGIARYVIKYDGAVVDSLNPRFTLNRELLNDGITYINIYAEDKRGNKGETVSIPIYNYPIIINYDGENVGWHIDDTSQSYSLIGYVNGEKVDIGNNISVLNQYISEEFVLDKVSKVTVNQVDDIVSMIITPPSTKTKDYKVSLEAEGTKYGNIAYSDEIMITKETALRGYRYAINQNQSYILSDTDDFINSMEIKEKLDEGKYYLHIAPVDSNGNMGEQYTKVLNVKAKEEKLPNDNTNSSNGSLNDNVGGGSNIEIEDNISEYKYVYSVDNASSGIVSNAKKMISGLPSTVFDMLKREKVKIYITGSSAEKTYKDMTGLDEDGIIGIFFTDSVEKAVIVEEAYINTALYHEIGHVLDYIKGGNDYISLSSEFKSIFEEERNLLYSESDVEYNSEQEFFAESFALYMKDRTGLAKAAPKAYKYLRNIILN